METSSEVNRKRLSLILLAALVPCSSVSGVPDEDPVAAAQAAVNEWLPPLDGGDYAKGWEALAKLTRARVSREQWVDAMTGMRGPLGAVRERKFITSVPLKPQPGAPDLQGLDLIYEASFAGRPFALDDFGVIREADGRWRVGLYRSSFRPGKPMAFTVPEAPWFLELPFADVEIDQQSVKPHGRNGYFRISYEHTELIVSFWIEPALNCKDSESCRDMVYAGNTPKLEHPRDLSKSRIGEVGVFEYLLPKYQGVQVDQQNMYAEFVVDGWWVDMHASKTAYKPADHQLFENLVKTVRFEPKVARP